MVGLDVVGPEVVEDLFPVPPSVDRQPGAVQLLPSPYDDVRFVPGRRPSSVAVDLSPPARLDGENPKVAQSHTGVAQVEQPEPGAKSSEQKQVVRSPVEKQKAGRHPLARLGPGLAVRDRVADPLVTDIERQVVNSPVPSRYPASHLGDAVRLQFFPAVGLDSILPQVLVQQVLAQTAEQVDCLEVGRSHEAVVHPPAGRVSLEQLLPVGPSVPEAFADGVVALARPGDLEPPHVLAGVPALQGEAAVDVHVLLVREGRDVLVQHCGLDQDRPVAVPGEGEGVVGHVRRVGRLDVAPGVRLDVVAPDLVEQLDAAGLGDFEPVLGPGDLQVAFGAVIKQQRAVHLDVPQRCASEHQQDFVVHRDRLALDVPEPLAVFRHAASGRAVALVQEADPVSRACGVGQEPAAGRRVVRVLRDPERDEAGVVGRVAERPALGAGAQVVDVRLLPSSVHDPGR